MHSYKLKEDAKDEMIYLKNSKVKISEFDIINTNKLNCLLVFYFNNYSIRISKSKRIITFAMFFIKYINSYASTG